MNVACSGEMAQLCGLVCTVKTSGTLRKYIYRHDILLTAMGVKSDLYDLVLPLTSDRRMK